MWVAAGGEGVGRVGIDKIHPRHLDMRLLRQLLDYRVKLGRRGGIEFLRAVSLQHHLVREPVAKEVHRNCNDKGDLHAASAAEDTSDQNQEPGQGPEQYGRLDCATEHRFLVWD